MEFETRYRLLMQVYSSLRQWTIQMSLLTMATPKRRRLTDVGTTNSELELLSSGCVNRTVFLSSTTHQGNEVVIVNRHSGTE